MKIADGRSEFYQWDHDQQLIVPADCTEVHFDNGTTKEALVCAVKEENGEHRVDVPNIFLQTAANIHAYAWSDEKKCVLQYCEFWVIAAPKPADYVYTQTEVLRIDAEIAKQLQELKDSGGLTGPVGPRGPQGPKGDRGEPGPAEVFIAEYGVTTIEEQEEAYQAGKLLFLKNGGYLVPLHDRTDSGSFCYYRTGSTTIRNYYCTLSAGWKHKDITIQGSRLEALEERITALGDIETALDSIIAIQEELMGGGDDSGGNWGDEITFYVNSEYMGATYPYTAREGMTWEEFVNGTYNPTQWCEGLGEEYSTFSLGWHYDNPNYVGHNSTGEGGVDLIGIDGQYALATDVIIPNETYITIEMM